MVLRKAIASVRSSGPLWTASLILDRMGLGTTRLWKDRRVAANVLHTQTHAILRAFGMSEEHASITTDYLMYADLRGIDSHGCAMLMHYHRDLRAGNVTMTPVVEVVRETEATATIDGGGGLGYVPGHTAMMLAISKCKAMGIAAVAVRNSGHFGAAGAYAALAAQSGFVGIATSSTAVPAVVPTHGLDAKLGTNPIAVAAPAGHNAPFLLDMATSTVPLGRIAMAERTGKTLPEGWAQDPDGAAVTNPHDALQQRRLSPLGSTPQMSSYKGYGLASAVEILSSILSGSRPGTEPKVGHFFLALDPSRFREPEAFADDLDQMMDSLRSTRPASADQPVLVAGDPEYAALAERSKSGIPLSRAVVEEIRALCRLTGAPFLCDDSKQE